jgi:hypothetical protein
MESMTSMEADNSKMQDTVQQVDQNPKRILLASYAGSKNQIVNIGNVGKGDKLKTIIEVSEEDTENSYENRVQGLSENNMMDSEMIFCLMIFMGKVLIKSCQETD